MPGGRAGDRPESHCGSALWRGEWECPGAAISQRQTRWVAPTPGAPLCPQVPRRDAKAFLGSRPRHSAWPCVLVRGLRLGRDLGWRHEGRPELLSARRERRGRVPRGPGWTSQEWRCWWPRPRSRLEEHGQLSSGDGRGAESPGRDARTPLPTGLRELPLRWFPFCRASLPAIEGALAATTGLPESGQVSRGRPCARGFLPAEETEPESQSLVQGDG